MDIGVHSRGNGRPDLHKSATSVTPATQEVKQTWSFAPSNSHNSDMNTDSSNKYHNPFETGLLSSHQRSPAVTTNSEEGLLRTRRHDPHEFARLLDPRRDKPDRNLHSGSEALEPAHIPVPFYAARHRAEDMNSPRSQSQRSSLFSSRPSDASGPSRKKHHQLDSIPAATYLTSKHRKTLHERLQGDHPQQSRLSESSKSHNPLPHYQAPLVKHEQSSPLHPAALITDMAEADMVPEEHDSSGCASTLNANSSGTNINARSGSISLGNSSTDARSLQGVVMEAMKTIQHYESENENQRSEIEHLNAHVVLIEKEKDQLKNQVNLVKSASLQKLATSSQSLEALRADLSRLKSDSQKATSVSDARALVADIKEMKNEVADALKVSDLYINGRRGGTELPGIEGRTREVVADLQLDRMNKQQVLDMLRDRLDDALSNLAGSKHRELELEKAYAADRLTLKNSAVELASTSSRINDLACALKHQQSESLDAMILAGDLEMQLEASKCQVTRLENLVEEYEHKATAAASLENSMAQLQSLVGDQRSKLGQLESISNENIQLKALADAREERIRSLEDGLSRLDTVKQSNARLETQLEELEHKLKICDDERSKFTISRESNVQLKAQLCERESKLRLTESELSSKSCLLDNLRTAMGKVQANLEASNQTVKRLEADLASSRAAETTERTQRIELMKDKTSSEQKLTVAERRLEESINQTENYRLRLEEANIRSQCVQERFEDQTITLRLTRDTTAELQDRLVAAEAGYAKNLETNCGALRTEIAILREQTHSLQAQANQLLSDGERRGREFTARETSLLEQVEDGRKNHEANSSGLRTQIAILQEQNTSLQVRLQQSKMDAETCQKEAMAKEATLLQRFENTNKVLETNCADLRTQIAIHTEQKSTLQAHLKQSKSDVEELRREYLEKEAGLLRRMEDARKDLEREVRRGSSMKIQLDREVTEARLQNAELQTCIANLQSKLQAVPAPCTLHEKEIETLKAQASLIDLDCKALKERSRTLNDRFDTGDLDTEERSLVKKIIEVTQSTHDHELAQTRNELHRRDNLISTLQDAKITLENSLAKHLEAEVRIKTAVAKSGGSVMDLVLWPSSQSDLSVLEASGPPAQDRDEPSAAPDDPPAQEDTELTPIPAPQHAARPQQSPLSSVGGLTPSTFNRNFITPAAGSTSKGYFSNLAPDASDEIAEFDDETIGTKRKKDQRPQTESSKQPKRAKTTTRSETQAQNPVPDAGTAKTTYASKNKRKRR